MKKVVEIFAGFKDIIYLCTVKEERRQKPEGQGLDNGQVFDDRALLNTSTKQSKTKTKTHNQRLP